MPNNLDMGGFGSPGLPVKSNLAGVLPPIVVVGRGASGASAVRVNAATGVSFTQINDNGTVVIDSDISSGTLPLTVKYNGGTVASVSYLGHFAGATFGTVAVAGGYTFGGGTTIHGLASSLGIAIRYDTTAQTLELYRSYTNSSNYSRLKAMWDKSTAIIHAEGAGTGTDGSVAFNDAALATNATKGFLMIPSCAGTPSGTPADIPTGQSPIVYDSTNKKLCVWGGAAWVQTAALS